MRMAINTKNVYDEKSKEFNTLGTFMESHGDNEIGHFYVYDYIGDLKVFRFQYSYMIGYHRLFIEDPYSDDLLSFFAEDFTDIGNWIFKRIKDHFPDDYDVEIAM